VSFAREGGRQLGGVAASANPLTCGGGGAQAERPDDVGGGDTAAEQGAISRLPSRRPQLGPAAEAWSRGEGRAEYDEAHGSAAASSAAAQLSSRSIAEERSSSARTRTPLEARFSLDGLEPSEYRDALRLPSEMRDALRSRLRESLSPFTPPQPLASPAGTGSGGLRAGEDYLDSCYSARDGAPDGSPRTHRLSAKREGGFRTRPGFGPDEDALGTAREQPGDRADYLSAVHLADESVRAPLRSALRDLQRMAISPADTTPAELRQLLTQTRTRAQRRTLLAVGVVGIVVLALLLVFREKLARSVAAMSERANGNTADGGGSQQPLDVSVSARDMLMLGVAVLGFGFLLAAVYVCSRVRTSSTGISGVTKTHHPELALGGRQLSLRSVDVHISLQTRAATKPKAPGGPRTSGRRRASTGSDLMIHPAAPGATDRKASSKRRASAPGAPAGSGLRDPGRSRRQSTGEVESGKARAPHEGKDGKRPVHAAELLLHACSRSKPAPPPNPAGKSTSPRRRTRNDNASAMEAIPERQLPGARDSSPLKKLPPLPSRASDIDAAAADLGDAPRTPSMPALGLGWRQSRTTIDDDGST
jgi:hypothetical protein